MLSNEKNSNLNHTQAQQHDMNLSEMMRDSSNAEIIDNPQAQQNKLSGLLKRSIKDFSIWSAEKQILAVSAAGGLFAAALPLLLAAAPLAATGAMIGLALFFSVKAVQSGYKGLKWSAEKTVEGAKHIGGKVKDGYEYSVGSLKRGTHLINEKTKEKASDMLTAAANKLYRAAGNENYSDRIDDELTPDSPQKRRVQEVKKDLKAIFVDKGNNSELIESIRSGISEKIEGKIKAKEEVEFTSSADDFTENFGLITRWKKQKKFIDNLDADGLRKLVTERLVDKSKYFKDSTFSEHHDEIQEVIRECKEEHARFNTLERLNKGAKRHKAGSINPLEQSLSGSSSMDSLSTDSTVSSKAELLSSSEHKKVNATSSLRNKLPSWLGGKAVPEEATYISYKDSQLDEQSADIGNSRFYVAPEKPPRSNSMGSISTDSTVTTPSFTSYRRNSDSGFNSPSSSTPQRHSPSQETRFGLGVTEELTEKLAKRRAIVDQPNVESVQQKAEPSKG
ncbi:hypothetical protein [Wolbachia endosymbiont of Armadillidium arcangelii]|uniref:Uncharacterized protein n=1 Tax=Wolbachia endosymbiont of Armadillidium arcangelii TaxID=3158571 RepID=A0AAU7Q380_9RICK